MTAPSVEHYLAVRARMETPLPARYNVAADICDRWADEPGRVALVVPRGRDEPPLEVTYGDLAERSSRLANVLEATGVARGDRVAVCLPQSLECAIVHLAIQRLGAVAVPLAAMAGPDALRHRVVDSGARVGVADGSTHGWLLDDAVLSATRWLFYGSTEWDDALALARPHRASADTTLEDPAVLMYTSGTSGQAKGALHAQRVVPSHVEPISLAHDLYPLDADVMWSPTDWAWTGGLVNCLFIGLRSGRPLVVWRPRGFDADEVLAHLEHHGVTASFLPPTALKLLREATGVEDRARRLALRTVMTGGERCGEAVIDWCRAVLGLTPNEVYGQTEASAIVGNSGTLFPVKPGSVGLEYPRARAAVLDDDGNELPAGELGEIAFHGSTAAMFLGYWNGVDGPIPVGAWQRTGDLGRRDEDGYLWHEGRRDDVILSAGYRIGPGEVEECLARHPAVRAVAVVGEPDELRGQIVTAVLELYDGERPREELERELAASVRDRLAPYEVPRRFHVVDALPRTDTGKIRRAELRRLLQIPTDSPTQEVP
ncbi:MAG: AMP-binding protein [Actinobacteria bacterium]|nr:AMP-binding protein [Actinomycetota bacterium]